MSGDNAEGKNNGWHLKNGNSCASSGATDSAGVAGQEKAAAEEEMSTTTEKEEEEEQGGEMEPGGGGGGAPPPVSRKRARSSGSISNGSELSTDSHGAKKPRVNVILLPDSRKFSFRNLQTLLLFHLPAFLHRS